MNIFKRGSKNITCEKEPVDNCSESIDTPPRLSFTKCCVFTLFIAAMLASPTLSSVFVCAAGADLVFVGLYR
jgi:hypothetical protein